MKFCPHCGQELQNNPKFCPSCGASLIQNITENDHPKMYKRESKSLQDNFKKNILEKPSGFVKEKTKEVFRENLSHTDEITNTPEAKSSKSGRLGIWTMVYFIAGILLMFAPSTDEKFGMMFFTIVILALAIFRNKKPKPYNLFVKIIIIVQLVFTIALIGSTFESGYGGVSLLQLLVLAFAEIMLLIKGNTR